MEKKKGQINKIEAKKKKEMLVRYDSHIIYRIYLSDEEKVICIKNLKIMENINTKDNSQLISYNAITIF